MSNFLSPQSARCRKDGGNMFAEVGARLKRLSTKLEL